MSRRNHWMIHVFAAGMLLSAFPAAALELCEFSLWYYAGDNCSQNDFTYHDRVLIEGATGEDIPINHEGWKPLAWVEPLEVTDAVAGWGYDHLFGVYVPATCTAVCSVEMSSSDCESTQALITIRTGVSESQDDLAESHRTAEFNKYSTIQEVSTTAVVSGIYPVYDGTIASFDRYFECAGRTLIPFGGRACDAKVNRASLSVTCVLPLWAYLHLPPD